MNARTEAEKIYSQTRQTEAAIRMGIPASPVQAASLEQIEAHIQNCIDAADATGAPIDYKKIEFGTSREEIFAKAEAKAGHYRRGAGYRALKSRYGEQAAKNIINRSK